MSKKKIVPVNESYTYLKKSINNLNKTQSSGPAPILYPKNNPHKGDQPKPQNSDKE